MTEPSKKKAKTEQQLQKQREKNRMKRYQNLDAVWTLIRDEIGSFIRVEKKPWRWTMANFWEFVHMNSSLPMEEVEARLKIGTDEWAKEWANKVDRMVTVKRFEEDGESETMAYRAKQVFKRQFPYMFSAPLGSHHIVQENVCANPRCSCVKLATKAPFENIKGMRLCCSCASHRNRFVGCRPEGMNVNEWLDIVFNDFPGSRDVQFIPDSRSLDVPRFPYPVRFALPWYRKSSNSKSNAPKTADDVLHAAVEKMKVLADLKTSSGHPVIPGDGPLKFSPKTVHHIAQARLSPFGAGRPIDNCFRPVDGMAHLCKFLAVNPLSVAYILTPTPIRVTGDLPGLRRFLQECPTPDRLYFVSMATAEEQDRNIVIRADHLIGLLEDFIESKLSHQEYLREYLDRIASQKRSRTERLFHAFFKSITNDSDFREECTAQTFSVEVLDGLPSSQSVKSCL